MKKTAMLLALVTVLLLSACQAKEQTPTSTPIPAAVEATAVPTTAPAVEPTAEPTSAPTAEPTAQAEVAAVDEAPAPGDASAIPVEALMNATYSGIYDEPVTLTDGFFEDQPFTVEYLDGSELYTDLDGDGAKDAVVFLLERGGGTANIIYMAAQLNQGSQPVDAGAVRLDEVRIKSATAEDGQIQLEVIVRGPGDGDCCPTHKAFKTYAYQDGQLVDVSAEEGELVQVSADDLNGTSWTLLELNYDTPVQMDTEVTISFQDGQITGFGGCNDYNSSFSLSEDNPFVMTTSPMVSTKKACPEPILDQETAYLTALDNVAQWGVEFGHLVLYYLDEQGVPARLLFAPTSDGEGAIGANPWQWVSFTSPVEQFEVETPENYVLTFNEDGTVAIVADCNNATGSYTDEDGALAIEIGPMTMAACPPESRGDQFVTLLGAAARYFFAEDGLFIDLMADGGTMRLDTAGEATAAVADQAAAAQAKLVASLTANPWKWTTAISPAEVVTVETPASYMVTFKDDGTVDIQADCNDATGTYTLDGSKVTIEVGAATLAACPGDSRSEQFLQLLGEASELLPQPGQLIVGLETEGSAMLFDGLLTTVVDLCGEEALAINTIEDTLAPEISAQLDLRLTSLVQDNPRPGPGGVMMIITSQGRYFKSTGVADVTSCEPLAADSPYQIGSNTKMMTTAILLQLQEEGVLSITDPLSKWLPELAAKLPNGDKITIDMLLTHTSGLHDYFDVPTEGGSIEDGVIDKAMLTRAFTPEELVRIVADSGLVDFEPGAEGQWHYSNTGYILLGLIIEKATGKSYDENLKERIFEPLGLEQTYLQTDVPESGALPQAYVKSPFDFTTGEWNASQGWSAGAVVSTPEEFALFLKALFTAKLFKDPATLDLMKQHTAAGVDALGPGTVYAHGMLDNNGVLGHGGQTLGFQSDGGYIPDKDVTIVLWSNAMESNVSRTIVPVIAAMVAGDEQVAQLAAIAPPPQLSDREPGVHTVPCVPGTGPYLAGEVEGEEYTCGVFTVPQNWDEPDGRYIDLGFVVAHARSENPAPDPLVSLEGGPGASAVFRDNISRYEMVRADRDIIKLDIRGVGLSQRTGYEECLVLALQNGAPAEQIEALQTTIGAAELLRYAGFESSVQVSAQPDIPLLNGICWDQFAAQGLDLNQFRSADFARDAVELVKALGHDSFNVEGTSYGTRLAMTILADIPSYPDAPDLRAVILDSPMPPSTYVVVSQPRREHDFLLEFLDDCVSDLACNTAYPNLDERLTALMDQLEQEPLTVGAETVTLDDFLARLNGWGGSTRAEYIPLMIAELEMGMLDTYSGLRDGKIDTRDPEDPPLDMSDPIVMFIVEGQALLNGTDAQFFPDIISRALNEDDPLTLLETAIPQLYPDVADELLVLLATMTEEDIANSAYLAQLPQADTKIEDPNSAQFRFRAAEPYFVHSTVHCAEDILYERYEDALNTYNDLRYPRVGTLEFAQVEAARCENYPVEVAPIEIKNPVDSPVPTLVLMAAYDKQTPPFMARRAARELENSTLVRVPQAGHGTWNTADRCVGQIVAAYIQNPDAALDLSCLDAREPQWVYPEESLSAVPGELPAELVAQLDAWLNSQVYTEGGNPANASPGLILLVETPEGRYLKAAGVSSLEEGTPMQADDILEIGSNTKSFTVVLIMQLQEEGVLSLEDNLSQWLPEQAAIIPYGDEVTLYQLANHVSGIPDYTGSVMRSGMSDPEKLAQGYTPAELVQMAVDNDETHFLPGEGWSYNNTGYILLGMVAEAATGQPLAELFQERIFDRLGLETAVFLQDSPKQGEITTQGYFPDMEGGLMNTTAWNASQGGAAGAIAMSAEDLATYGKALANGELFQNPDSLAQMLVFNPAGIASIGSYGLGLFSLGDGYWGHEGTTLAFQSLWFINPEKGTLAVGLSNSSGYGANNFSNVLEILEGRGAQPLVGFALSPAAETDYTVFVARWQWDQITDASGETAIDSGPMITLQKDDVAIVANDTCGSATGTYTAGPSFTLAFDLDTSTLTCPEDDPMMELLGYLDMIDSWRFENGGMVIVLTDGTELAFRNPY